MLLFRTDVVVTSEQICTKFLHMTCIARDNRKPKRDFLGVPPPKMASQKLTNLPFVNVYNRIHVRSPAWAGAMANAWLRLSRRRPSRWPALWWCANMSGCGRSLSHDCCEKIHCNANVLIKILTFTNKVSFATRLSDAYIAITFKSVLEARAFWLDNCLKV